MIAVPPGSISGFNWHSLGNDVCIRSVQTTFSLFQIKLHSILFKVQIKDSDQSAQNHQNGQTDENTEPSSKRRKFCPIENSEDSSTTMTTAMTSTTTTTNASNGSATTTITILNSELRVYDKNIK